MATLNLAQDLYRSCELINETDVQLTSQRAPSYRDRTNEENVRSEPTDANIHQRMAKMLLIHGGKTRNRRKGELLDRLDDSVQDRRVMVSICM